MRDIQFVQSFAGVPWTESVKQEYTASLSVLISTLVNLPKRAESDLAKSNNLWAICQWSNCDVSNCLIQYDSVTGTQADREVDRKYYNSYMIRYQAISHNFKWTWFAEYTVVSVTSLHWQKASCSNTTAKKTNSRVYLFIAGLFIAETCHDRRKKQQLALNEKYTHTLTYKYNKDV